MEYRNEHGQPGHLNIYQLDQDSVITGFGKHHRVIAFLPDAEGLHVRVDHKHGPRVPTESEVLAVARKDQGGNGRWNLADSVTSDDGRCTWLRFDRAGSAA